ncbi:MAG: S8 family serine peptidase [Acidobacteriota bacterium]|nr:S8 family serine peptidase [Acidobacteriota bacterium]
MLLLYIFTVNSALAGLNVVKSSGISLTGADGIRYVGTSGISLTGADGFLNYKSNGISLTGADGISLTGADGISLTGADGVTYTGANGISLTGADGISLTGADGISLTGADGAISLTGADGAIYTADSIIIRGADGISLTGADGAISLTGADGISLTGADGAISLTGADGISLTGADGISLTGADDETPSPMSGLQSVDPELALWLDRATDDSNVNAVIAYHKYPAATDLAKLRQLGILGGTQYRILPMIMVTATRQQLIAVSRLPQVRSIYGNRTLKSNIDPFFNKTQVHRINADTDLQAHNSGLSVSGRNVTVAVLDTGVNSTHTDLSGKVVQNVRLQDTQSAAVGFIKPLAVENVPNTDPLSGHGTFVAGVVAGSGAMSGGKYSGVAPGAKILGLAAGDLNLTHVLAGFDYLLEKGANYNVRVVNCSFSANTVYDFNDPVNIATKTLTERGISVVFSAGNAGAGNGTLNPYAAAPWVVSVGATDEKGNLAKFSSRGVFGDGRQAPSIVAPGVNVVSLRSTVSQTGVLGVPTDLQRLTTNEMPFYTTASGTSFSAPLVAGTIAMMLEANPNLKPAEIKDILQRSATPMPLNYRHETGAGFLNAYAAVLEAAFPQRRTGIFRSTLETHTVKFATSVTQTFNATVVPGLNTLVDLSIPANALQSNIGIAWGGQSVNDLAMKVYDADGVLRGESNNLNTTELTGRREKVNLINPAGSTYQAFIRHTNSNFASAQEIFGLVQTSRAEYAPFGDLGSLAADARGDVYDSLRTFLMLPHGEDFRTASVVSRADLAAAIVRGGRVPQYVAKTPMYSDTRDLTTRSVVESVQSNPSGKLIFDASTGGAFRPDASATRLVAAVAFVKAANLENLAATAVFSPDDVIPIPNDANSIPSEWRGYVVVALQKGFLKLDGGNNFNPNRAVNRLELAQAMTRIVRAAN